MYFKKIFSTLLLLILLLSPIDTHVCASPISEQQLLQVYSLIDNTIEPVFEVLNSYLDAVKLKLESKSKDVFSADFYRPFHTQFKAIYHSFTISVFSLIGSDIPPQQLTLFAKSLQKALLDKQKHRNVCLAGSMVDVTSMFANVSPQQALDNVMSSINVYKDLYSTSFKKIFREVFSC